MTRTSRIVGVGAVALLAITSVGGTVFASSHREAPLIARDPSVDNTDLYAFVSPDAPDTATIIANYTGFQEPSGGPNYFSFDPTALYWIKVDNNGDGVADVTYTFTFTTDVANPDSFLYSGYGPIPAVASNVTQTLSVMRNDESLGTGLVVPPPNIGPRTTPGYGKIADTGINTLTGDAGKVFAGQRDDPFFADLGSIFDLGALRPFQDFHLIPKPGSTNGVDTLSAYNVNSIAIQVPKSALTNDGKDVTAADATNAVVGIWAGASRKSMSATGEATGDWVQVSRLGNPLINEVIIPLGQKDAWNAGEPADDAQYAARYLNPELAAIINTVYPALPDIATADRTDLQLILGQGVPTLNSTNSGDTLYDELRLNLGVPPTAKPDRLGVLAGDLAGFPNGRRLGDDVIDIEIRAVAQGYGKFLADNFQLPNLDPNNQLADGVNKNDKPFLDAFPYVAQPWQGYKGGTYRLQGK
jgi:Domain of unknown function (DUF4331)